MQTEEIKRLFFGFEVQAPWPEHDPHGRIVPQSSRHLTLAFLGNIPYEPLSSILPEFPAPPFKTGPVGYFNACKFLPEKHPRVASWHVEWFDPDPMQQYPQVVQKWLASHAYPIEDRPFLSHVTIGRSPFHFKEWREHFIPLPMVARHIHLYESKPNLTYIPIWSYPLLPPFEEFEHTADIAFRIQGKSVEEIHLHAQIALAFRHPPLLKYLKNIPLQNTLNETIIELNNLVSAADSDIGCPFKAVSFHGDLKEENGLLTWEMIVDV